MFGLYASIPTVAFPATQAEITFNTRITRTHPQRRRFHWKRSVHPVKRFRYAALSHRSICCRWCLVRCTLPTSLGPHFGLVGHERGLLAGWGTGGGVVFKPTDDVMTQALAPAAPPVWWMNRSIGGNKIIYQRLRFQEQWWRGCLVLELQPSDMTQVNIEISNKPI